MNALDLAVEPWLFRYPLTIANPRADERDDIALWAVKTAMMRGFIDNDNPVVPPGHYSQLRGGVVPQGWRVLIARSQRLEWLHTHHGTFPLVGWSQASNSTTGEGPLPGLIQHTSWTIGHAAVSVILSTGNADTLADTLIADLKSTYPSSIAEITAGEPLGTGELTHTELVQMFNLLTS